MDDVMLDLADPDLVPAAAELAVLASAFWEPAWLDTLPLLPSHFAAPIRGALWAGLRKLRAAGTRPDAPAVIAAMGLSGEMARSMADLLVEVATDHSIAANAPVHADTIIDRAARRHLLGSVMVGARQRLCNVSVPVDEGITFLEQGLSGVACGWDREADELVTFAEFVAEELPPVEWVIPDLLARGERTIVTGTEGSGKALAVDTPIPTPRGWTTMGELAIGDEVLGADGKPTAIVAATDIMLGRPCYRVIFSDGTQVVADAEHQWLTEDYHSRMRTAKAARRQPGTKPRGSDQRYKRVHFPAVITTEQMAGSIRARGGHTLNHTIDAAAPLDLPAIATPIDPYLFGVWLGDGDSRAGALTCGDADVDHMRDAVISSGYIPTLRRDHTAWHMGITTSPGPGRHSRSFVGHLRQMGVLRNKHIPAPWLRGSFAQRLALLQGLMDTDGTVGKGGHESGRGAGMSACEFSVVSERLARDVCELVTSLGIIPSFSVGDAKLYGRIVSKRYRITFQTDLPVFRLPRKAERLGPLRTTRSRHRFVTSVEAIPSVPVRCIQVANPDHMYLATRAMIPTHNSVLLRTIAVMVASGLHPFTLQAAEPRRVLVVDCENPQRIMHDRFAELGKVAATRGRSPDGLMIRRFPQGIDLGSPADRMRLRRLCQLAQPDLLVIGPVYKMYMGGGFSREEDLARLVANAIDGIREEFGCAVLMEHHVPKGEAGQQRGALAPIGSSLWMRWPEFGFGLAKDRDAVDADGNPLGSFDERYAVLLPWRGGRDYRPWPHKLQSGGPGGLPWVDPTQLRRP